MDACEHAGQVSSYAGRVSGKFLQSHQDDEVLRRFHAISTVASIRIRLHSVECLNVGDVPVRIKLVARHDG